MRTSTSPLLQKRPLPTRGAPENAQRHEDCQRSIPVADLIAVAVRRGS